MHLMMICAQAYFYRYLFSKPAVPMDVQYATLDLLDSLEAQAREAMKKKVSMTLTCALLERILCMQLAAKLRGNKDDKAQEPSLPEQLPVFKRYTNFEEVQQEIEVCSFAPSLGGFPQCDRVKGWESQGVTIEEENDDDEPDEDEQEEEEEEEDEAAADKPDPGTHDARRTFSMHLSRCVCRGIR
jgi:hypothetical protein